MSSTASEAEHEARVARSKELANRRRTLEGQVDLSRSKLSRLKDQLMAVKTNKEYTAMLHEIQVAEEQIRSEEDKILEIMEEMETKEKDLKGAEQEMQKKSAELQESIRKTNESAPLLEADLEKLRQEKRLNGIADQRRPAFPLSPHRGCAQRDCPGRSQG